MTTVIWRVISFAPAYQVSDEGLVREGDSGQPRCMNTRDSGYLRVKLVRADGRRLWYRVHLLVLETFTGPRPTSRHQGAHSDGNKANNRLDNLLWKTPEANAADKKLHGTATGGQPGVKKLPARVIHDLHGSGDSLTSIAKTLDAHRSSVARVVKRPPPDVSGIRFQALKVKGRPRYLCVGCTSGWVGVKFNPEGAYEHARSHMRRGDVVSSVDLKRLQKHALKEEAAQAAQ